MIISTKKTTVVTYHGRLSEFEDLDGCTFSEELVSIAVSSVAMVRLVISNTFPSKLQMLQSEVMVSINC